MKNIFLLAILIFLSVHANSQAQRVNGIEYDTCSALHRYEGEWLYANGNDTIRIYLRFHRDSSANEKYVQDLLWGWHEYKNGNIIIESNYQYHNISLPYNYDNRLTIDKYSIHLNLNPWTNISTLNGTIRDYSHSNESHTVKATFNSTKQLCIGVKIIAKDMDT